MSRLRRLAIGALSFAGVADAFYMLAFDEGLIDHLVCPFFGRGCEIVGRSRHNKHFGIPNAAIGAVLYSTIGALALWAGDKKAEERPEQLAAATALSAFAVGAGAYLTYEQAAKIRAFCFWCLTSMGISSSLLALSALEAAPALKYLWERDQDRSLRSARRAA
jgi:uncharacterized membrane protein